jgi:hypothetical protein
MLHRSILLAALPFISKCLASSRILSEDSVMYHLDTFTLTAEVMPFPLAKNTTKNEAVNQCQR